MNIASTMAGRTKTTSPFMRNVLLIAMCFQFSAFVLVCRPQLALHEPIQGCLQNNADRAPQILHYSRVMPTPDGHRYLPSTAVFLVEAFKLMICLTIAFWEFASKASSSATLSSLLVAFGNAIVAGDSWKMAVPASLYTLANSLQYVAISNLDAATFHVVYQFKIIVTALFSVLMLRKTLTPRQWLALLLLMIGVALVSMPHQQQASLANSHHTRIYLPRSANPILQHLGLAQSVPHMRKRSATYEGIEEDEMLLNTPGMDASVGLLSVLAVCLLSGWSGVYFERVIKDSTHATSLWIRNVQLSLYSLFPAFFIGIIFLDGEHVAKNGFFAGYNWIVVFSIGIQSVGGIVAAFCIYYADNISKNFAISISMILSGLASMLFFDFHASSNVSRSNQYLDRSDRLHSSSSAPQ
jgi:drug/metabolite transporter (DMT)-like permease